MSKEVTLLLIRSRVLQWAVCFRGKCGALVMIGSALLLICCGDPEAKAQQLLNQAQVLERAGKEHEAHQLLDEIVKGYPQTNAATKASELLNKRKALKSLLSSVVTANEASALARMRTIGTAQLIHRSTAGEFGSLEALANSDLLPGMTDGISAGYKFMSKPGKNAALNFTATAEPVQMGKTGRTCYFLDETQLVRCNQEAPATAKSPACR